MASSAEDELVIRLRNGDAAAYEMWVRGSCDSLLAMARRILANEEDAREALQDGYLAAFRGIQSFDGRSALATWLTRIVLNAALMKRRAKLRRPECSIDALLPQFDGTEHHAVAPTAWQACETNELAAILRAKIDELPEAYRTVLILRDLQQLDTAETARILETSPAVIKTRLHRARLALRTLLDPHLGQP